MNYGKLLNTLRNDGYLLIENFFSDKEVQIIQTYATVLKDLPEIKGGYMKYYENSNNSQQRILARIENFVNDKNVSELYNNVIKKVSQLVDDIMCEKMNMFKDKINWKLPGGGKFKPHQDFEAWSDFPATNFLSCAIFVDNCTIENGCLEMVKGEHTNGVLKNINGCLDEELVSSMTWKPILSTKKDLVIFDAFVPHRSDINRSTSSRRIIYLTYNKSTEGNFYKAYFDKKRIELPPDFERNENTEINLNSKYNLANPIS